MDRKRDTHNMNLSMLPMDIMKNVLSHLPIPELCRMRVVCKSWKELTTQRYFHNLLDENNKHKKYLFMEMSQQGIEIPKSCADFNFLDLEEERWYAIPASRLARVATSDNRLLWFSPISVTNSTLACELTSVQGTNDNWNVTLLDPVARTKKTLPTTPKCWGRFGLRPVVVSWVDNVSLRYKVLMFNNLKMTPTLIALPRAYYHEQGSNKWQVLKNAPSNVTNAICFRDNVLVAKILCPHDNYNQLQLFRYNCEDHTFVDVWRMHFRKKVISLDLMVNQDRLFVNLRTRVRHIERDLGFPCPNSESLFLDFDESEEERLEVFEILLAEGSRRPVVKFSAKDFVELICSETFFNWYVFPCLDVNGNCTSVVLTSFFTGKMWKYHISTGKAHALPTHPFSPANGFFFVKAMNLSLRNVLAMPDH